MRDRPDGDNDQQQPDDEQPSTFIVPGSMRSGEDLTDDELADAQQQMQDLGSASRSCVAIIAVLIIMALLLCVFLMWAFFIQ